MIVRQAGTVCAGMDEMNIAVTIGLGMASCDGELVGTGVDRGGLAPWTYIAGKPSRGVASAAADVGDAPTGRDADPGHDPRRIRPVNLIEQREPSGCVRAGRQYVSVAHDGFGA